MMRRMNIEILKPDVNESSTRFTVHDNKIRFGLGSIKNVGVAVVDAIVLERTKNGPFVSFTDFCERVQEEAMIGKVIGFAPMVCLFVGYLIVPLCVIGLGSMGSAFSGMEASI